jgi:PD-(D/E)XK nuclease superfamily
MLVIPEHVLKAGPWSISKAGVIEKCPLQFDFKYGPDKIPEVVKYEQSRVGVAVHKALEMCLGGADQKRAFQIASEEQGLTTDEHEQVMSFWDQVTRFVQRMVTLKKKHGVSQTFIETKWGVRTDFKGCKFFGGDVFFRGVVDYALRAAGNHLIIIDHKSGKEHELSYYDKQFRAYCIMALAMYPELKGVQTAINFIQTDNLAWNPYVKAEQIRDEYIPWMVSYLTESCQGLLSDPAPKRGWWCGTGKPDATWGCPYRPICPIYGGSGRVEEAKQ